MNQKDQKILEDFKSESETISLKKDNGQGTIHVAASKGRLDVVQILMNANHGLLEQPDMFGQTALLFAAANGHENIVEYLINQRAELNVETKAPHSQNHGKTPLYWATERGHTQVVAMLIKAGATTTTALGERKLQPIHIAIQKDDLKTVKALIENDLNLLEQPDAYGLTPFFLAAGKVYVNIAEYLISQNAILQPQRPIHMAAQKGDLETVKALIENDLSLLDLPDLFGQTPLLLATVNGHTEVVDYLIAQSANVNVATNASYHSKGAAGYLKSKGVVVSNEPTYSDDGKTPLYWAAERGHSQVVARLIKAGAMTTTALGDMQFQPIHIAAQKGDLETVKALIENDPGLLEIPDKCDQTALLWAAAKGHISVVRYLIHKGANVNVASKESLPISPTQTQKKTSLYWATKKGHNEIVALLEVFKNSPKAYTHFFTEEPKDIKEITGETKENIMNFFADYYCENRNNAADFRSFFKPLFYFFKELSRHHMDEAKELVKGIGNNKNLTEIKALLEKTRGETEQKRKDLKLKTEDSHFIRRIDFALAEVNVAIDKERKNVQAIGPSLL